MMMPAPALPRMTPKNGAPHGRLRIDPLFDLADRKRLSDIVANRIRDYIITNQLQPGDRLPTELEMAQQFGVSRVSIREATKALCFLGFLDATPRRGTIVGQVDFRRVSQFLELHPALKDATARQLVDTRLILELGMLPYLCDRMQRHPEVYQKFVEHLDAADTTTDVTEWLQLDCEFHCLLVDSSGLSPMFLCRELIVYFFGRLQGALQDTGVRERLEAELANKTAEHRRLIDLLRDQKLDQAQRELKSHVNSYLTLIEA